MSRLQELWTITTNSCGAATAEVMQEIKEIEKELEDLNRVIGTSCPDDR